MVLILLNIFGWFFLLEFLFLRMEVLSWSQKLSLVVFIYSVLFKYCYNTKNLTILRIQKLYLLSLMCLNTAQFWERALCFRQRSRNRQQLSCNWLNLGVAFARLFSIILKNIYYFKWELFQMGIIPNNCLKTKKPKT